jgi:D-alanyl-D-alanine dipeptidase
MKIRKQQRLSNLIWTLVLVSSILFQSCVTGPPREKGTFKSSDLVELVKLDTTIHLDIKYATTDNFSGMAVYPEARAFLQRPAAEALVKVSAALKPLGYGLIIYDGYRPWSVTKTFWDITSKENKKFVANPKEGSKHNRGCAIDLNLYELASGKVVEMTSKYDEMNESAYPNYTGGTEAQRKMRDLLKSTMEAAGFTVFDYEWWHYDYKDWKAYRIENIQFSEIK